MVFDTKKYDPRTVKYNRLVIISSPHIFREIEFRSKGKITENVPNLMSFDFIGFMSKNLIFVISNVIRVRSCMHEPVMRFI